MNLCTVKGCLNGGRYCRLHISGTIKEVKLIAPRSKKLTEVMKKEYVPQVKEMIKEKTACKVNSPVCAKKAQGFHHLAGRIGTLLTDKKKKIPCCNSCNLYIETNDAWARQNGFKLSKFSEPAKNQKRA